MADTPNPWRAWRETIPGLTQREVSRRSGINSGRLSIIERGVTPTDEEAARIRAVLIAASEPKPPEEVPFESPFEAGRIDALGQGAES